MIQENPKFEEFKNSTLESAKNRFSDPLIGNYLITFIIYNWKIFLYIFSGYDTSEKILQIEKILEFNFEKINFFLDFILYLAFHPILFPFYVSLFYIFIYPKITKPLRETFLDYIVQRKNETYAANEKLTPIEIKISDLEQKLSREVERNNTTNDAIKDKDRIIGLLTNEKNNLEHNLKIISTDFEKISKNYNELNHKFNNLSSYKVQPRKPSILNEIEKKVLEITKSSSFNKERFKKIAQNIANAELQGEPTSANDPRMFISEYVNLGLINKNNDGNWIITELGKLVLNRI